MEIESAAKIPSMNYEPGGVIDAGDPLKPALSAKEQKKLDKAERAEKKRKDKWKVFVDFLLRHISIVTTKYVAWEKNEFETFKEALEKAQRLDDKESELIASTYKKLKQRSEILATRRYYGESNKIRKFIDMVARMRGLNLIARDFYKSIKKAKLEPLENTLNHLQYWKGFVSPGFEIAALSPKGVDANHPGMKYVMWLCLFRTVLNLSQKFLQSSSELTEIPLVAASVFVSFNLTEEQLIVSERLEEILATHVTRATGIHASPYNATGKPSLSILGGGGGGGGGSRNMSTSTFQLPGESDHLTFELPPEPPKEKKKGKKGKGKKGGAKKKKKKK